MRESLRKERAFIFRIIFIIANETSDCNTIDILEQLIPGVTTLLNWFCDIFLGC